ncbi:hypothetical protein Esti_002341 [Eimeria stiedai]
MASNVLSEEWPCKQSLHFFEANSPPGASSASVEADVALAANKQEFHKDVFQPTGCALVSPRARFALNTKTDLQSKSSSKGKGAFCRSFQANRAFGRSDSLGTHFFNFPIEDSSSDSCESISNVSPSTMPNKDSEGAFFGSKADGMNYYDRTQLWMPWPYHCTVEVKSAKPSCIESLEGAEDGRYWLDRLDKLRSGTSKEEYKKERSRVVDALIRRAASYPKVSGIYFDKHQQLRWSVGWANHGKRAAKYFPVKLFGMREGYGMAVRFKSTKSVTSNSTTFAGSETSQTATEHMGSHGNVLEPNLSPIAHQPSPPPPEGVSEADSGALVVHAVSEGSSKPSVYPGENDMRATSGGFADAWKEHTRSVAAADCDAYKSWITIRGATHHTPDCGGLVNMSGPPASFWSRFTNIAPGRRSLTSRIIGEGHPQSQSSTNDLHERSAAQRPCFRTADCRRRDCGPCSQGLTNRLLSTHGRQPAFSSLSTWRSCHMTTEKNFLPLGAKHVGSPPVPLYHELANKVPVAENTSHFLLHTLLNSTEREGAGQRQGLAQSPSSAVSPSQPLQMQSLQLTLGLQQPTTTPPSERETNAVTDQIELEGTDGGATLLTPATKIHGWTCSLKLAQNATSGQCTTGIGATAKTDGKALSSTPCPSRVKEMDPIAAVCTKRHEWGKGVELRQPPQVHHTTGIHFDKHSLRWKATWYNNMGQRKAKYFPIGRYGFERARMLAIQTRLSNHVPRGSRCSAPSESQELPAAVLRRSAPLLVAEMKEPQDRTRKSDSGEREAELATTWGAYRGKPGSDRRCISKLVDTSAIHAHDPDYSQWIKAGALSDDGYDEDKDRRLSKAPSRVLIRHASRLSRVPGIWFDKKQLRWACTFTDMQSGKRRAEYFPIRQFGFLGARRLAMTARKRLDQFRIQACTCVQKRCQHGIERTSEGNSVLLASEHKKSPSSFLEWKQPKNTEGHDLWNKYFLETMQRHGPQISTSAHGGTLVSSAGLYVQPHTSEDPPLVTDKLAGAFYCGNSRLRTDICRGRIGNDPSPVDSRNLLTDSGNLLSLEKEAVRFLLLDLRTRCLRGLSHVLSPGDSVRHMSILQRHSVCVDYAERCQNLEQYLVVFAECIKHMKLPSHLCQAEQRRLLHSIAALAIPPAAGL